MIILNWLIINPIISIELFLDSCVKFYYTLRSLYSNARIVLLSGTMVKAGSRRETDLDEVLKQVKEIARRDGDTEVYQFSMNPEHSNMGWGSAWHPSKRRYAKMAEELTRFL